MFKALTSYQFYKSVEDMFMNQKKRKKSNLRTSLCHI